MKRTASSTRSGTTWSVPSSFGRPLKNRKSAECATEPRSLASTSWSIVFGSITRSKNQAEEQSAKRSSSVTLKTERAPSSPRTSGCVRRVCRVNARLARSRRLDQPFALAMPSASSRRASSAQSPATVRSRSRSVGAVSRLHVSEDSGRRVVQRCTSAAGNRVTTSSQNGLASLGLPSSVAASRTRYSRSVERVQAV